MADDKPTLRVLGIAGSLRAGSFNRSLLRAAQELAPEGMDIRPFDIAPIPLYNARVRPEAAGGFAGLDAPVARGRVTM